MTPPERCSSTFPAQPSSAAADVPGDTLQCLSRGYLAAGPRCACTIPERAVDAAWRAALEDGAVEGFFRFTWRGGRWLGYGDLDGRVRGVYCPEHAADRDQRAHRRAGAGLAAAPVPQPVA